MKIPLGLVLLAAAFAVPAQANEATDRCIARGILSIDQCRAAYSHVTSKPNLDMPPIAKREPAYHRTGPVIIHVSREGYVASRNYWDEHVCVVDHSRPSAKFDFNRALRWQKSSGRQ